MNHSKNGALARVSPTSPTWTTENEHNNGNSSKEISLNLRSVSSCATSSQILNSESRPNSMRDDKKNLNEINHMRTKISASNVKVAFKETQKSENDTSSIGQGYRTVQRQSSCLPATLKLEFRSNVLEDIYQRHYKRQKLDQIMYIILIGLVVNLSLIGLYSTAFGFVQSNKTQLNRVIVTCTFGIIDLLLIAFHFLKLFHDTLLRWLPYFVWFSIFSQLLVDLVVGYEPLAPSDSVGMFMFFIFITYVILPARMLVCVTLSAAICVSHLVVITICAEKNIEHQSRQVSFNFYFQL